MPLLKTAGPSGRKISGGRPPCAASVHVATVSRSAVAAHRRSRWRREPRYSRRDSPTTITLKLRERQIRPMRGGSNAQLAPKSFLEDGIRRSASKIPQEAHYSVLASSAHEEGRRRRHPQLGALLLVGGNPRSTSRSRQTFIEAGCIQTQLHRDGTPAHSGEAAPRKECPAHLPELALRLRAP